MPFFNGTLGIEKVPEGDWWAGLWQFPRSTGRIEALFADYGLNGNPRYLGQVRHSVTTHRIYLEVWTVACDQSFSNMTWVTFEDLGRFPMPSPQRQAALLAASNFEK